MVLNEIKAKPASEMASEAIALKFAAGKEIPLNYLKEGNKVFVGADGPWWREFKDGPTRVSLVIKSKSYDGLAVVILFARNTSALRWSVALARQIVFPWSRHPQNLPAQQHRAGGNNTAAARSIGKVSAGFSHDLFR